MIAADLPYFKLPFQCGQVWSASTYAGHWPDANSLDLFRVHGETQGQPLYAPATGILEYTGWWSEKSGWTIILDHGGGWKTYYLHLREASFIPAGQEVKQGQHIGYVGNSGTDDGPYVAHLHYTVMAHDIPKRAIFSGVPAKPHVSDINARDKIASRNCGSSWDGDARADLVLIDPDGTVKVYLNQGSFAFAAEGEVIATGRDTIHFADLDGDGRTEIVDGPHADLDGDRRETPQAGHYADLDGDGRDEPVAEGIYADIDGNGRDELIKVNAAGEVEAYWNMGNGEFDSKPDIIATGVTDPSRLFFA